jgi:hypothetical protein
MPSFFPSIFGSFKLCKSLQSLPSKIGELKNLKYLGLAAVISLKVIPHEISQLTSLSTLDARESDLVWKQNQKQAFGV